MSKPSWKAVGALISLLLAIVTLMAVRGYHMAVAEHGPELSPGIDRLPNAPKPGIYVFEDYNNLDPNTYPIVGGHMDTTWEKLEPQPGVFDWSFLDSWIETEASKGKPVAIGIDTYRGLCCGGDVTPRWVYEKHPNAELILPDNWHLPKYWDQDYLDEYGRFLKAVGEHLGDDPRVAWIEIGVGLYGETTPAEAEFSDEMAQAGLTSDLWVQTVNRITDLYLEAFPRKPLLLQFAPVFKDISERKRFTDYAAEHGVGLKHDGLRADADALVVDDPSKSYYKSGQYDPFITWGDKVPIGWEGYDYLTPGVTGTYWGLLTALHLHSDYLVLSSDIIGDPNRWDDLKFANAHLGRTVYNTPDVWVALRETEYSWFPLRGNYSFYLYQNDDVPGGKSVPLWNVGSAKEGRYARRTDEATGNRYLYFDIDDRYLYEAHTPVTITVTYYDKGEDTWSLQYDAYGNAYKTAGVVHKHNTLTWKKAVFHLTDARFANSLPGGGDHPGSDFRIWSRQDGDEIIHMVMVSKGPAPSPTPTATPTTGPTMTPTPTPSSPVVVLQQGLNGYSGAEDTYISQGSPDLNFGNAGQLLLTEYNESPSAVTLLRFRNIPAPPPGTILERAELKLRVSSRTNASPIYGRVYGMTVPWKEDEANWHDAYNGHPWDAPGASGSGDHDAEYENQIFFFSSDGWGEEDITGLVRRWMDDPSENYGMVIQPYSRKNVTYRLASSDSSDRWSRPQIVLYYGPENSPTPTQTPTPSVTPTPTPTPMPTTVSYRQGADGYDGEGDTTISQWAQNANYGNSTAVSVRSEGVTYTLIHFDLPDVPAGSQVLSATLRLYLTARSNTQGMTLNVYRLLRPWKEMEATWLQASNGDPWQSPGASGSSDRDAAPVGSIALGNTGKFYEVNITPAAAVWGASPDQNFGLLLAGESKGSVEYYFDSGDTGSALLRPELALTYIPGNGQAPTPTTAPMPTSMPTRTPTPTQTPTAGPPIATATPLPGGDTYSITFRQGVNGYAGVEDAKISRWSPSTNYGDSKYLSVRARDVTNSLLRFDLSSIPTGAVVESATLSIYCYGTSNGNPLTAEIYGLRRPWEEGSATWSQASDGNPWGEAGAYGSSDRDASPADSVQIQDTHAWHNWDVTSLAQKWVSDPQSNYGVVIQAHSSVAVAYYCLSSEGTDVNSRPTLAVTYRIPPTPTPTPTATSGISTPVNHALHAIWASAPIVVDGNLDEWTWPSTPLNANTADFVAQRVIPSLQDCSGQLWTAWDGNWLYFAVHVNDDVLIGNDSNDVWRDDSVELAIDGAHDYRGYQPDDHQLNMAIDGRIFDFGDPNRPLNSVRTAWKLHPGSGYDLEVAVPASLFPAGTFSEGHVLGFTWGIHDDDDGGDWDSYLIWAGDRTTSPEASWGTITLDPAPPGIPTNTPLPTQVPTITPTPTSTPTPETITVPVSDVADTYLDKWHNTAAHGSDIFVVVRSRNVRKGVLRFDLSDIPVGSRVLRAELSMYPTTRTNSGYMMVSAYPVLRSWDERMATWMTPWGAPGASGSGDVGQPVGSPVRVDNVHEWFSWDLTPMVQQWVDSPGNNHGVLLAAGSEGASVEYDFLSSEYRLPEFAPKLKVTFIGAQADGIEHDAALSGHSNPGRLSGDTLWCYGSFVLHQLREIITLGLRASI